ncbi:porin family protein [Flavobacterium gawalongense]|uniref:PorT family protein n=1 Tax=Flavobacterium gawalongense TaxID=2594432 RepID=A0A553BPG8_9FLAO|nr:porin family protein [Flavobacterium gawalongense]TRX01553.1 PorT family protein [Flavobacterium gawalongense]TRX06096.1 PorT family protein [Flavobacterium gawalongense]TRX10149.1 PorT family protein [Flavobacterium gawalongense]TRX11162.1 PorT family protein [Flavobacterium gawalongense]TRX28811.1 PorT family protein [Flavobacterium gawalongense]
MKQTKTKFLTIALFIGLASTINAQENTTNKSNGGIKGGYNLAAVSFDGDGETEQRHSFHVGVYGESFISESFSIQPELMYSQQGYVITNSNGTFTQKLNYINLPIMLKAYPSKNFFLEAGPQIGLAVSHKEEYDGLFSGSQEYDPNSFDWGLNFGGGFKTDSGISLGVRYHLGLGDLYDEGKAQNRVWQFSIGFDL